jgi:hypothetical protein
MKTDYKQGGTNQGGTNRGVRRKIAITYGTVGTFHLITSSTVGTRYIGLSQAGGYAVPPCVPPCRGKTETKVKGTEKGPESCM